MPAPHRARALSNRHMVAAGNYHAALVGMNILEAGGNAVDAGVAAGIVLGVTNCDQVNFGGVAPIMIRMSETGKVMTISGLGWWPKAANIEYFHENFDGKSNMSKIKKWYREESGGWTFGQLSPEQPSPLAVQSGPATDTLAWAVLMSIWQFQTFQK